MPVDARVCESYLHCEGVHYYRGGAHAVQLGDVGEKRTPVTQDSHLIVRDSVPRQLLKIGRATSVDVHRAAVSGADLATEIAVPGLGVLGPAVVARELKDQALAVVKLECRPQDIIKAAQVAPSAHAMLLRAGAAGRLVHQVFVVLEMRTSLNFTRATYYEVRGSAGAWTVTGVGGSRTVVALTAGTTLAYLLLKPAWALDPKTQGQVMVGWENDPWALP